MPTATGIIAEIQAKVDLLAYVSQYVTLRKRGREYTGLCPFHAEKTPSFSLNAEKQVWHCYGCDAGGDLISFVKRYENVEFPDALRMLAARAGVALQESSDLRRRRSEREAIYEANAVAKAFFSDALSKSAEAQAYVARRGLAEATCERFGLGFAPDSWDGLTSALARAKVDLPTAARAGLISRRQNEEGYIDFFRRRLMFPIFNLTGEVIAFGGRALGDAEPKYLNTKNTPVFTKGQHVYGLAVARKAAAAQEALIVVEGYMDCLALHQAGFGNVVATSGTAFTPEQARELRRVANNVYLCFDGDAAGQAATTRNVDMLVEEGLHIEVVTLPGGRDPDDLVREGGPEAFATLLAASRSWTDFKIDAAIQRIERRFASKSDVARQAMAVIARVHDPIEKDQYIKAMARKLDVDEASLRSLRPALVATQNERNGGPQHRRAPAPPRRGLSFERELIQLILARPALLDEAMERVATEDFEDEELGRTYDVLHNARSTIAQGVSPVSVLSDAPNVADLTRLALSSPPLDAQEEAQRFERILERFDRRRMQRRLYHVDAEMNRLFTEGKSVPELLRDEYNSLSVTLRGAAPDKREGKH